MNAIVKSILDEARKLPPEERVALAEAIIATIEPDPSLEKEWAEEINDRVEAYRRGELTARDFDEVIAELRRK